ncbi:hydroxymethylglutaryl-CoA lyase [Burkholderiaceae bacterium DAT-1]|nr:hydroxymethylglutaryl-CoA lyase [Burkholderiaceae bacterium DAT-1]
MALPKKVTIVEVGPRDGLQNEKTPVSTETKLAFIDKLADAGLKVIEATAFVSPKWVPQMADHLEIMQGLKRRAGVRYPVLVPNMKGYESARSVGADEIAVFGAASEAFSQKNINCSIDESIERFAPVIETARRDGVAVRGYVSCVMGCPYQGDVPLEDVARVAQKLYELGCYEISLGDTIGRGTPEQARRMIEAVAKHVPVEKLAAHFHDTWGMATANLYAVLDMGVATIDSSAAGLGGCPYAKGASGNVATEDVVYLLNGLGIESGVNLDKLAEAGRFIGEHIGRSSGSKTAQALAAQLS